MLNKFGMVCLLLLLSVFNFSANAVNSGEIIDGFSEFLIDRANVNLIAVFERRLKNDKNFQCYFPNTYDRIDSIRLENLFTSKQYWEVGLEQDLEILIYRSILQEMKRGLDSVDRNKSIDLMQYVEYEYNGQPYSIDFIEDSWPPQLKKEINGFSNDLADSINRIAGYKNIVNNICSEKDDVKYLKDLIEGYSKAALDFIDWVNHVKRYGKNLRLTQEGENFYFCGNKESPKKYCFKVGSDKRRLLAKLLGAVDIGDYKKMLDAAERVKGAYQTLKDLNKYNINKIERVILLLPLLENSSFTKIKIQAVQADLRNAKIKLESQVNEEKVKAKEMIISALAKVKQGAQELVDDSDAENIIFQIRAVIDNKQSYANRALVALDLLEQSDSFELKSYERLNRAVMFFASIADAKDKDAVKSILNSYALPKVSFNEKRKYGSSFFISSYFGYAAADSEIYNSVEQEVNSGLFVPIGIEYNYGLKEAGSLSVMLSPIDMGYPVNLKLNGIEDDVDFDEIVAPSITLAYGFKNYPINIGLGYQRGRNLADVNKAEERILLFVSFDMPLFRLY